MKSCVLDAYPYQDVDISQYQKTFVVDEKKIEKSMSRLLNKHVTWASGGSVAAGDVVCCSLASGLPKFQHDELNLTVGSNLFDKEFEAALLGKKEGDAFSFERDGQDVGVKIFSVKNKQIPALCDEFVRELSLEHVDTVEEYRAYLKRQQLEEVFREDSYEVLRYVQRTVLEKSRILLSKEDWQKYVEMRLNALRGLAGFDGFELEKMTAKEFDGRIPVKSYEELVASIQYDAWDTCRLSLLGRGLAAGVTQMAGATQSVAETAEISGTAQPVTTEGVSCDAIRGEYEEFMKEQADIWKRPIEECRAAHSYELFEINYYTNYYDDKVLEYLKENLYR